MLQLNGRVFVSLLLLAGCEGGTSRSHVDVARIVIEPAVATIVEGGTQQFTAFAEDARGQRLADRTITWSTSDASRATVSSTGLAAGLAAGEVAIAATSEGRSASAALTVEPYVP